MTIQTPTSEVPGGLPDLAALNRLAGAFFAALPGSPPSLPTTPLGGVPAPVNVLPGGSSLGPLAQGPQLPGTLAPAANLAPTSPQSVLSLGASAPSLVPHSAAPNGLPDNAAIVPPALDGRVGTQALGVPTATGAAPDAAASFGFPTGEALRALLTEPPRHATPAHPVRPRRPARPTRLARSTSRKCCRRRKASPPPRHRPTPRATRRST